jgi:hypothetical protein
MLYTNDTTGMIVCERHGGMSLRHELHTHPNARTWHTAFGIYRRWDIADDAEWIKAFGKPAKCESCEADEKRALLAL